MRLTSLAVAASGLAALIALIAGAAPAAAQPSAREARANAAFDAGDLDTALREFEAALAEAPRPNLLYVIGRVHVARGDCAAAVPYFDRFLATHPGPNAAASARTEIARCRDGLSPPARATPLTTPPGTVTAPPPARLALFDDRVGQVLVVAGVAAAVTGAVLYVQARGMECAGDPCFGPTFDEFVASERRAHDRWALAMVAGGAGAALLVAGGLRFTLRDRATASPQLGVAPNQSGAMVVVAGPF